MRQLVIIGAIAMSDVAVAAEDQGTWTVGLGTRDSLTEPGHVEGVRGVLRHGWTAWGVELDLYATPSTDRTWRWEDPWDQDPYLEDYIDIDKASAALLLDWGRSWDPGGPQLQLRPHILAGLEGRRTIRRYPYSVLLTDGDISYIAIVPSPEWAFGPDLGVGLTVHAGPHIGLRLMAMDRMRMDIEERWLSSDVIGNPYLRTLHDLTASADLLVSF